MKKPLSGIRVLDFSRLLPGPYCTWLLADQGAEVIRIENPREIKKQARVFGWDKLSVSERERLREQDILARNKQSVMLDIGDPTAQPVIKKLAASVDVIVEDYRPGVLESLGLGHTALGENNAGLITCSLTLCGQTGPYKDKPGHDPVALSISGVLSRMGEDAEQPSFAGVPVADVLTGSHAAFAILAAIRDREHTHKGRHIDVAMSDCSMSLLVNVLSRHSDPKKLPVKGSRRADMGLWRCADGLYLCTTDMEPRYWERFCHAVEHPEFIALQNAVESRADIRRQLEQLFASKSRQEWLDQLEAAQTQFAPVLSVDEALSHPHNIARGIVPSVQAGDGTPLHHIGSPVRFGSTGDEIERLAVMPGTDNERVFRQLGLDESLIKKLSFEQASA